MNEQTHTEHDWYKDAVIYELHVRSYMDSNGDGMGDFRGLTNKLDYLQDLGVNAIWVLPFYPSPWRDDGYDISDYTGVHSAYGTIRDFKRFLKEAHARDLKVITELVINHTSNQHPWFERSRTARPGSKWRDFYVWSETPEKYTEARIIFQDFESSNWTWDPEAKAYYWHRFYSHQPDLNFDNPDVQREVFKVLDYWFSMGIDGVRLDAVPYLFERDDTNCENLPETHEFLRQMRAHVDTHFPDGMLLAEANQWPEDAVDYFGGGSGDECNMAFHFPLMPRLFMSLKMEDAFPVIDILDQTPAIPETSQWGIFLRNHDELTLEMVTDEERDYMYRAYGRDPRQRINLGIRRRLAPLLDNNRRRIELMNSLLFSLPGTPVIYYGDEIGMGDNVYLGDRDGVRTPMQWSSDRNAGFSDANPQRLYLPVIIDPEYHHGSINVETQQNNGSSLLWWMKRIIATRRRFPAFSRGDLEVIPGTNHRVFAFLRRYGDESILVIVNFSRHTQVTELELSSYSGYVPEEAFSQTHFPTVRDDGYTVTIGGNDFYWLQMQPAVDEYGDAGGAQTVSITGKDWTGMGDALRTRLERELLPPFIRRSRWFREKSLKFRRTRIADTVSFGSGENMAWLLVIELVFSDDRAERYLVPIALATGDEALSIREEVPHAVIADATLSGTEGAVLYDGVYSDTFRTGVFHALTGKKRLKAADGTVDLHKSRGLRRRIQELPPQPASRVLSAEQSNTSILYEDSLFLKVFRKLESGINPDVELTRYLTEQRNLSTVPAYGGSLTYAGSGDEGSAVGLLIDFVPNQGDAWGYTRDSIERFFETILVETDSPDSLGKIPRSLLEVDPQQIPDRFLERVDGFFLEMIELLGKRTGELHQALAGQTTDPAFTPEPFSRLYQRSLYQSLRSLTRRVNGTLKKARAHVPAEIAPAVETFLSREAEILERFQQITARKIDAKKIRIHGDYHLGQVLFTGRDFVIIDLEGEPARTLSERRLKFSAFRDVAGMLRSFHYAISSRYLETIAIRPEDGERLEAWIRPWYTLVGGTFLHGYLETVAGASFVPGDRDAIATALEVFLLEKAVYEVVYYIDKRTDWLRIHLDGIELVLDAGGVRG
ncbi:MAG: maltose alpha-D-glucosyltransferase [Spirochaeta sp.]|nr:maltose alpha-D-glucosyltransferase [Spirochaeta sp.]